MQLRGTADATTVAHASVKDVAGLGVRIVLPVDEGGGPAPRAVGRAARRGSSVPPRRQTPALRQTTLVASSVDGVAIRS